VWVLPLPPLFFFLDGEMRVSRSRDDAALVSSALSLEVPEVLRLRKIASGQTFSLSEDQAPLSVYVDKRSAALATKITS
jgi:hypothetical protein